jgi:hypothetical protein
MQTALSLGLMGLAIVGCVLLVIGFVRIMHAAFGHWSPLMILLMLSDC